MLLCTSYMKGQIRIQNHIDQSIQKPQQGATQTCSPTGDDRQFSESLFGCFSNLESRTDVSSRFFRFFVTQGIVAFHTLLAPHAIDDHGVGRWHAFFDELKNGLQLKIRSALVLYLQRDRVQKAAYSNFPIPT